MRGEGACRVASGRWLAGSLRVLIVRLALTAVVAVRYGIVQFFISDLRDLVVRGMPRRTPWLFPSSAGLGSYAGGCCASAIALRMSVVSVRSSWTARRRRSQTTTRSKPIPTSVARARGSSDGQDLATDHRKPTTVSMAPRMKNASTTGDSVVLGANLVEEVCRGRDSVDSLAGMARALSVVYRCNSSEVLNLASPLVGVQSSLDRH